MGDLNICPSCSGPLDSPQMIGSMTVCPSCLRTLVIDGDTVRLALGADTVPLEASALDALRALRKSLRKARI